MAEDYEDLAPWRIKPIRNKKRAYVRATGASVLVGAALLLLISRAHKWGEPLFWAPVLVAFGVGSMLAVFLVRKLPAERP